MVCLPISMDCFVDQAGGSHPLTSYQPMFRAFTSNLIIVAQVNKVWFSYLVFVSTHTVLCVFTGCMTWWVTSRRRTRCNSGVLGCKLQQNIRTTQASTAQMFQHHFYSIYVSCAIWPAFKYTHTKQNHFQTSQKLYYRVVMCEQLYTVHVVLQKL